jgi:glucose/arabinose dehydrogenase
VTVGSNSNIGENGLAAEEGRAAIWEVDLRQTGEKRLFASGLRNPVGMAWEPAVQRAVDGGERARRDWAATWCPTTSPR